MGIVRFLLFFMLVLSAGTMGLGLLTGQVRFLRQGQRLFQWTLVVLALFFAVLVAQHQ